MGKFLQRDSTPKVVTDTYDVCEMVILHIQGKGLDFTGVKGILEELFTHDEAKRLFGLIEPNSALSQMPPKKRTYRSKGESATWWNPLGYFP